MSAKVVQCEHCGRIRLGQAWTWADWVVPDVIGTCATCGAVERQKRLSALRRDERETRRKAREGYGPAPAGEDVFKGFRE